MAHIRRNPRPYGYWISQVGRVFPVQGENAHDKTIVNVIPELAGVKEPSLVAIKTGWTRIIDSPEFKFFGVSGKSEMIRNHWSKIVDIALDHGADGIVIDVYPLSQEHMFEVSMETAFEGPPRLYENPGSWFLCSMGGHRSSIMRTPDPIGVQSNRNHGIGAHMPQDSVLDQLRKFIKDANRRHPMTTVVRWIGDDTMKVYVRRAHHLLDGVIRQTLDLASAEVYDKGRGTYTRFSEAAHAMNPWYATYHESVLNERLADHWRREGWHEVTDSFPPSFWKTTLEMNPGRSRFLRSRGGHAGGVYTCIACGRRTRDTREGEAQSVELCGPCYDDAVRSDADGR